MNIIKLIECIMRILFLFCLFFLSTTTFAKSETTISKNFYGTWGDNCEPNGQENSGFVFGRSGYIYFYKSSSNSDSKYDYYSVAFSKSKQFENWKILEPNKNWDIKKLFAKIDGDILTIVEETKSSDSYSFLDDIEKHEKFTKCKKTPDHLIISFGELLAFLNSENSLECINNDTNQCIYNVFKFLDVSKNNALSIPEITRGSKLLISLVNLSAEYSHDDNTLSSASAYLVAPILAKIIISNYDFDNSKDLSLKEIFSDREILIEQNLLNTSEFNFNNEKLKQEIDDFIKSLELFKNLM